MDKTQPARVAPEHQAELNAITDAAEARRNAATAGELTDEQLRDALRQCPHDTIENLRVRWLYAKDFARAAIAAHEALQAGQKDDTFTGTLVQIIDKKVAEIEALKLRLLTAEEGTQRAADAERVYRDAERLLTMGEKELHAEIAALRQDKVRLDFLDRQGEAYGFQDMHEGNRWLIEGPFKSLRVAIDEGMAQAVQPS